MTLGVSPATKLFPPMKAHTGLLLWGRKKNRNSKPSNRDQTFSCNRWDRVCLSDISFISQEYARSQCGPSLSWYWFKKPSHDKNYMNYPVRSECTNNSITFDLWYDRKNYDTTPYKMWKTIPLQQGTGYKFTTRLEWMESKHIFSGLFSDYPTKCTIKTASSRATLLVRY